VTAILRRRAIRRERADELCDLEVWVARLDMKVSALCSALVQAHEEARLPVPAALEPGRPPLRVLQGGRQ